MKARDVVIYSIILIAIYLFVRKTRIYTGLFAKVAEWIANGIRILTTGSAGNGS